MILIFSCSEDITTDFVIDWLHYYNQQFFRLNVYDLLDPDHMPVVHYSLEDNILTIGSYVIPLEEVNAVWFRKLGTYKKTNFYKTGLQLHHADILNQLAVEYGALIMGIIKNINPDCYWITGYQHIGISKWHILKKAKEVGLDTPKTYFTNNKSIVLNKCAQGSFISKTMAEPFFFTRGNYYFTMLTKDLEDTELVQMPDHFFPSLVQEKIEKKFEIRTFFLGHEYYSMAIFSQNDPQTTLDFRDYNMERPNRYIPYKLPKEIEYRLDKLMNSIDLNCGSIDLIKDQFDRYVFLEVNPNGQFGMVEGPCNYQLYKKVAERLIEEDQKRTNEKKEIHRPSYYRTKEPPTVALSIINEE